ncbi:unnamed protein product [Brugia timori]|uniref:Uncharacterized protein n=1 Tax=Brugia timori TaxID=42155 RepID=A0A0R3Q7M3_9BILA|nr:unnamed protein product [Brugia timori]
MRRLSCVGGQSCCNGPDYSSMACALFLTTARAALFEVHARKVNVREMLRAHRPPAQSLCHSHFRGPLIERLDRAVVMAKVIAMAESITAAAGPTPAQLLLPLLPRKRAAMPSKPKACARG